MANTRTTTSTSRKPRTAARAASRPARTSAPAAEEPEVTAAEAQEIEGEGHYITLNLCGEDVRIVPPTVWRTSWQRLLNAGQIDAFAEKIFHPDDFEVYLDVDPTMEEWVEFTTEATQVAGESLGNSSGPAPSSRRTRRR